MRYLLIIIIMDLQLLIYLYILGKKIIRKIKTIYTNLIMADYEENKQKNSFTLFNNETGKSYNIPVIKGSDGPDVLDIRKLYQQTGMFTYDPGFTSTASCDSSITYIDGNKGILRHRGYDIK